jgi:hypothetical protein
MGTKRMTALSKSNARWGLGQGLKKTSKRFGMWMPEARKMSPSRKRMAAKIRSTRRVARRVGASGIWTRGRTGLHSALTSKPSYGKGLRSNLAGVVQIGRQVRRTAKQREASRRNLAKARGARRRKR